MDKRPLSGLRVALVFTPYKESEYEVVLKETREHMGVIPPLTLAYVAAVIEAAGARVELLDLGAEPLPPGVFERRLQQFAPDFVGFTLNTYHFHHTLDWIRRVRRAVDTRILVGGVHFTIYPVETMAHPEIDCGVLGDALGTVEPLLAALAADRLPEQLPNVAFRRNGDAVITPRGGPRVNMADMPPPARHLLPNERYNSLLSKRKSFTAMMSSRGCPYNCVYCENTYIRPDFRPATDVVDELERCYRDHGIREVDFFDASFTTRKQRVHEICDELKRRALDVTWSVRTRVDLVDEPMLQAMASAGCVRIYYGIESGVEEILARLNRTTKLSTVRSTVAATRRAGMAAFGYFMFGCPGETEETIRQTARFSREIGLDFAMYSPVFTPPNTELYNLLREELGEDYWARFTLDEGHERVLPRVGTTLSDERIHQAVREAFLAFYLRPQYILRRLMALRSLDEAWRSATALMAMVRGYFTGLVWGGDP